MPIVTLPHNLVAGALARAAEVMANLNAILTQAVNGNITDDNISPAAGIQGSKLSNVAGSRVPTDRIEDDAVTFDKLRDDATVDGNRAVTTNHLRDSAVVAAKIAAQAVVMGKVKTAFFDWNPPDVGPASVATQTTGITTAMGVPLYAEIRFAGPPTTNIWSGRGNLQIFLNTANSTYYLVLGNIHDTIILSTAGYTYRFVYIPVS